VPFGIGNEEVGEARQPTAASKRERAKTMSVWCDRIQRFLDGEDGPTAVEYAVMLALIVVVCIGAVTTLGSNSNKAFSNVALNAAAGGAST
jgi:pilus assembly protein Flp/PilA